jgi:predicted RNase H-like HicB family nuclease
MKYLVVIEEGETSWGAHVPDLPGCVAVGQSRKEAITLITQAVEMHIDGLRGSSQPIPAPASDSTYVETNVA